MGVLSFDGVNDRLKWTTLAAALGNVGNGAFTIAVVAKRNETDSYGGLSYLLAGAAGEAGSGFNFGNAFFIDVGSGPDSGATTFLSTASPYMLVVSKGAGSVAPRLAWKLGSGGAWTHLNMSPALDDQSAGTELVIGDSPFGDFIAAWIGVVAYWEGAMSDANKEALDNNWRTSDLWSSAHGQPAFLAELNVAGASVVDLAANASVLTATGTTLDGAETLDSWNFDGTGVAQLVPRHPAHDHGSVTIF